MDGIEGLLPSNSYEDFTQEFPQKRTPQGGLDLTAVDTVASRAPSLKLTGHLSPERAAEPLRLGSWIANEYMADLVALVLEFATSNSLQTLLGGSPLRSKLPRIAETIPQFGQEPGPFGPIDETPVELSLTVEDGSFPGAE
jgi:hypothetical protein